MNKEQNKRMPQPLDGGWGWIIVIASFFIHMINDGLVSSFAKFVGPLRDDYNERISDIILVLSLINAMTLCSGPIASLLINLYSCRTVMIIGSITASVCFAASYYIQSFSHLILIIGFGAGCSIGLIRLPAIVGVTTYFEKYRSIAIGVSVAGSGVGTLICNVPIALFIDQYGWRGTMLLFSGIILICGIMAIVFRPLGVFKTIVPTSDVTNQVEQCNEINSNVERSDQVYSAGFIEMMSLFKQPVFILFVVLHVFASLGLCVPFINIHNQANMADLNYEHSLMLVTIMGISNIMGRIVSGLADISSVNRLWTYNICLVISGSATLASIYCMDFYTLAIYAATVGFMFGAQVALTSVVLVDIVGLDKFTNAYGLLSLFEGIVPFSVGFIVGFTSYSAALIFGGAMVAVSGVLLFAIPFLQRNQENIRKPNL